MINTKDILETINMIKLYNLDIRTVTMAISLRDCIDRDVNSLCKRIREKILHHAENLVKFATIEQLEIRLKKNALLNS